MEEFILLAVIVATFAGTYLVVRGSRFWGNHKEVTWKHFLKLGAGLLLLTGVFYYTEYLLGPSFGVPVGIKEAFIFWWDFSEKTG